MGGALYSSAETCKQSLRGAGLVSFTYDWDVLAVAVVQGSRRAQRNHLSSHVTVGLEATVTGGVCNVTGGARY